MDQYLCETFWRWGTYPLCKWCVSGWFRHWETDARLSLEKMDQYLCALPCLQIFHFIKRQTRNSDNFLKGSIPAWWILKILMLGRSLTNCRIPTVLKKATHKIIVHRPKTAQSLQILLAFLLCCIQNNHLLSPIGRAEIFCVHTTTNVSAFQEVYREPCQNRCWILSRSVMWLRVISYSGFSGANLYCGGELQTRPATAILERQGASDVAVPPQHVL